MKIRFIADLHIGHKKMLNNPFRGNCPDLDSYHDWLVNQWNIEASKNDLTWVLGDVSFSKKHNDVLKRMIGSKNLILGNHDQFDLDEYRKYFNKVHGFVKKYNLWLSHAPIKDSSLRGRANVHGHTHSSEMVNGSHICVTVEALNGKPITLKEILEKNLSTR